MTLQDRIDRAVEWRAQAQDARANALVDARRPDVDRDFLAYVIGEWTIRRWLRAGYILRALLERQTA